LAGWPVFPLHDSVTGHCSCSAGPDCRQSSKHPRTQHGFHDATTSVERVAAWWRRWPTANVAIATGRPSGLVVVDLDGPDGLASWERLVVVHGEPQVTAVARTPHGRHLWFRLPEGISVPRRIRGLGESVDLLGDGGYVVRLYDSSATGKCRQAGGSAKATKRSTCG
jgi:hypothetical protein